MNLKLICLFFVLIFATVTTLEERRAYRQRGRPKAPVVSTPSRPIPKPRPRPPERYPRPPKPRPRPPEPPTTPRSIRSTRRPKPSPQDPVSSTRRPPKTPNSPPPKPQHKEITTRRPPIPSTRRLKPSPQDSETTTRRPPKTPNSPPPKPQISGGTTRRPPKKPGSPPPKPPISPPPKGAPKPIPPPSIDVYEYSPELDNITSQTEKILKYKETHFKKLNDKCSSGVEEFRQLIDKNNDEMNILQNEVERVNKTINAKFGKMRDIQKEISANSKKLEDYTRTSDSRVNNFLETIEKQLIHKITERSNNLLEECKKCDSKIRKLENNINEIEKKLNKAYPKDCSEVQADTNGAYGIQPGTSSKPFLVWCDMKTRDGGWTYVLNRFDGSQNFENDWNGYKFGFGTISKEYWIGLENLYHITSSRRYRLLIKLKYWNDNIAYAHYDYFKIGSEEDGYKLENLGTYSGTVGECLEYHLGMKFGTYDRDQDLAEGNCDRNHNGGWWHSSCYQCKFTGLYKTYNWGVKAAGIHWKSFMNLSYNVKTATMMIKPF